MVNGRLSRGWRLAGQSWNVLWRNPTLAVFPVLATVFATIAMLVILIPATVGLGFFAVSSDSGLTAAAYVYVAVLMVGGYIATVIAIFFSVALTAVAAGALRGEDVSAGAGIRVARERIRTILAWSLLTTTVGTVLGSVGKAAGGAGDFLDWLGDMAWSAATFFVIPVIALEDKGAKQSVSRSGAIVKERWGEGASGAAAIGVAGFAVVFLIVIVGTVGVGLLLGANLLWAAVVLGVVATSGVLATLFVCSALVGIFKVAVYQFAVDGSAPRGFDTQTVQQALHSKGE